MSRSVHIGKRLAPDDPDRPGDRGTAARQELVSAFWLELAEHGRPGLSVANIVRRAGCSRGRLYHHFGSLDELLATAYRLHTESTLQYLRTSIEKGVSVEDALVGDVVRLIRTLRDVRLIHAILELHLEAFCNDGIHAALLQDYRRKTAEAARLIRLGMAHGEFRPDCDPDLEADTFYGTCFGIYHLHVATRDARDLATKMERQLRSLLRGLRA